MDLFVFTRNYLALSCVIQDYQNKMFCWNVNVHVLQCSSQLKKIIVGIMSEQSPLLSHQHFRRFKYHLTCIRSRAGVLVLMLDILFQFYKRCMIYCIVAVFGMYPFQIFLRSSFPVLSNWRSDSWCMDLLSVDMYAS